MKLNLDKVVEVAPPPRRTSEGTNVIVAFVQDQLIPHFRKKFPHGWDPKADPWHELVDLSEEIDALMKGEGIDKDTASSRLRNNVTHRANNAKKQVPGLMVTQRGNIVYIGWVDPEADSVQPDDPSVPEEEAEERAPFPLDEEYDTEDVEEEPAPKPQRPAAKRPARGGGPRRGRA